jgi:peroxiredoxin
MKNIKLFFFGLILTAAFAVSALAQNMTFTSLGGEKIDLASQKGKVIVLAIGASWLPLSKNQAAAINKLARKYNGRDVAFFFIATDSTSAKSKNYASNEDIQKFAETNKMTISILRDSDGVSTIKQYKVDQLPAFIVIDKTGNVSGAPLTGIETDPNSDISVPLSAKIDKLL